MQRVTQCSIVIASHEEELIQMSRITESKSFARLFWICDDGNVSKLSTIRNSTRLAQDADGEV